MSVSGNTYNSLTTPGVLVVDPHVLVERENDPGNPYGWFGYIYAQDVLDAFAIQDSVPIRDFETWVDRDRDRRVVLTRVKTGESRTYTFAELYELTHAPKL